jgi:hypothetical protein
MLLSSRHYYGINTRRVPHGEHELLTIPKQMTSPPDFSAIHAARYLVFCVVSVLLSFFFWTLYCLSFDLFDLLLLNLALNTNQSTNHSSIYGF